MTHPAAAANAWVFNEEAAGVAISDTLTVLEGSTFAVCDRAGDIGNNPVEGVFVGDTRVVSRLVLTIDGQRIEPLATHRPGPAQADIVGRTRFPRLVVSRHVRVAERTSVEVELTNPSNEPVTVVVHQAAATDLADIFAVKEGRADAKPVEGRAVDGKLVFGNGAKRGVILQPSGNATVDGSGSITWRATIDGRQSWACGLQITALRSGQEVEATPGRQGLPPLWRRGLPAVDTDIAGLAQAVSGAAADLDALRLVDPNHPTDVVVAAGAPWFMTLFGRDSILASWMALVLDPHLALATARTLARLQGRRTDDDTEEQPGRILHEIRFGEAASLALSDGSLYFGTADATPLFVALVGELWRWGVPWNEIEPLLPAVDAALDWIGGPGDPDGDGYVEYRRTTPSGLANQGWKDSWDAISFADGTLATPPIALAEVQAYVYAAWIAGADLADAAGRTAEAVERRHRAECLQGSFNRDFWLDEIGAVAVALDTTKKPVNAVTSNMGHCLWTGILAPERAAAVARWLTGNEMFSGWGVRTLASSMARYDPLSYHNGSVWPHDTALCVAGLRRAGCTEEALLLATALLRAAEASGGRLPELFSGLSPGDIGVPVAYPASCSPQAWASAAPLLLLRAILGLEPNLPAGTIHLDPVLPPQARHLRVQGLHLGDGSVDVEIEGDAVAVRGLPHGTLLIRPG